MPRGPSQRTLTFYLINKGVDDPKAILRPGGRDYKLRVGQATAELYVKVGDPHPPKWLSFFDGTNLDFSGVEGMSVGAVLLITASKRLFAVTFGFGHLMLQTGVTDERFGLRVTLNTVDHNQIRSVDRETLDSATPHSQIQANRGTSITDFGLNIEQDLLRAVTGTPRDQTLGKRLTGKDGLKTVGPFTLDNLTALLTRFLAESKKKDYKEHFGWVDHIREVKDPALRHELDEILQERLRSDDHEGIWLAVPERIDWQTVQDFTYTTAASAEHHTDIHLTTFLDHLRKPDALTVDALKARHRVYAHGAEDDTILHEWSVYQCLYAEIPHAKAHYLLNNGKWYDVEEDFRTRIETAYEAIPRRKQPLPASTDGEKERAYNERVRDTAPQLYAFMDGKTIPYPDPRSPIELCDLYTNKRELIHVKRYGQSSTLSHHFAQGVVSGTLFARDTGFRKEANKKLPTSHRLADPTKPLGTHTVTYAVISKSQKPLNVPFFSKVTLNNAHLTLRGLGYNVQLTKVSVE